MSQDQTNVGGHQEHRRSFLKKVGIGAAVAWTAPTIATTKAWAQGTCGITGPLDITGTFAWYDAADTSVITPSPLPGPVSVSVAQWNDKSGNGYHLTQATGANQPTWQPAGINGLGSVEFDGTTDFMETTIGGALAALTATTVFMVVRNDITPDGPVLWGYDSTTPTATTAWDIAGPDPAGILTGETFSVSSNSNSAGTSSTNYTLGTDLVTVTQSTTASALRVNLAPVTFDLGVVAQDLTPSAAGAIDTLRVGASTLASPTFFDGQIAEIIIYNSVLSTLQIDQVECYLNLKWFV